MRFLLKGAQNEKNESISCCVGNWWIDYKFIFLMSKQLQQNSNQLFAAGKIKNKQENSDNSVNHDVHLFKNKVNQYLNQGYSKPEDLDKAVFLGSKIKNK